MPAASRNAASGALASTAIVRPAGEGHHEVGAQPAVVEADLLGEVAVVDQAGELDGAAQVELAPLAAHLRLAERGGQGRGLAAQPLGGEAHVGHLLVELGLPGHPVVGEVAELVLQPVEAVADHGVVGGALLEGGDRGGPVDAARACPQHADQGAEPDADEQRQQQGEEGAGVHGPTVADATDTQPDVEPDMALPRNVRR